MLEAGAGPQARSTDLIVTETVDALVVYDRERHQIHQLNDIAAAVWRGCDGRRTARELAHTATSLAGSSIDTDGARLALTQLADAGLLAGEIEPGARMPHLSRRQMVRRAVGAGVVAAPAIVSITAPVAAQAQSCAGGCVDWSKCEFNEGKCCMLPPGNCGTCVVSASGSSCNAA